MSDRKHPQQQQQRHLSAPSGPLVIGAGLMLTGTHSLMKALEILLGGRCYHMKVLLFERPAHTKLWYKAATEGMTKELANELLEGFCSTTDYPAAHFYRELSEIYPNAKIVLSVSDPKRWVESVRATIQQAWIGINWMLPPVRWLLGVSYFLPLMDAVLGPRLGLRFDMSDAEMARVFDRHTESVVQAIPKDRLLVFRVSDGWEPLCKFLDLPVPDEPFPNVNEAHFWRGIKTMYSVGATLYLTLCSIAGAGLWFGAKL